MKIQIEPTDTKYIYIAIFVIVFVLISAFQYNRNKGLREKIKQDKELIRELNKDVSILYSQIDKMRVEKEVVLKRADSFGKQEQLFKNKYYVTNKKLQDILGGYVNSDDATKNELFTNAVNN